MFLQHSSHSFKSVLVGETLCQSDFFMVKCECYTHPAGTSYILVVNCVQRIANLGVKFTKHGEVNLIDFNMDDGTQAARSLTSRIHWGPLKITTGESSDF